MRPPEYSRPPQLRQHVAQAVPGPGVPWREFNGLPIRRHRLLGLSQTPVSLAQIVVIGSDGWVERDGLRDPLDGFANAPRLAGQQAQQVEGGIITLDRQDLPADCFSFVGAARLESCHRRLKRLPYRHPRHLDV